MPELPEVAALVDHLRTHAVGHRIARVDVASFQVLKTFDPPVQALEGALVTDAARAGKFLLLSTDVPASVVIHLSRAGWLHWRDSPPAAAPRPGKGPLAMRFTLVDDGGEVVGGFDLTEAGTQKRLAVSIVADPHDVPGVARLGPDPLADGFGAADLFAVLQAAGGRQLKGVLRDQSLLAGIGNAYSDDILHAARMSPFRAANTLSPDQAATLQAALEAVLTGAMERAIGAGTGALKAEKKAGMRVHGRSGKPCPVCGDTIREVTFADSSLQYCPTCQTEGRPLADRRMSRLLK